MATNLDDGLEGAGTANSPFPCGVASADGKVAVLACGGVVTVLDLASGETIAEIARASRPLAVSRERLVAWEPIAESPAAMRLVTYSLAHLDAPQMVSEPIVFPGWVDVSELSPAGLRAEIVGESCTLLWQAQRRLAGGALPTEGRAARLARDASGAVRVDLRTGAVESSAEPISPPRVAPAAAQAAVLPEPGARDAHAIGRTLFYLVNEPALLLKARSLDDDRVLWEKPLARSTRKTRPGPLPRQP